MLSLYIQPMMLNLLVISLKVSASLEFKYQSPWFYLKKKDREKIGKVMKRKEKKVSLFCPVCWKCDLFFFCPGVGAPMGAHSDMLMLCD